MEVSWFTQQRRGYLSDTGERTDHRIGVTRRLARPATIAIEEHGPQADPGSTKEIAMVVVADKQRA
jgi:hypothetical protein